ncbi:Conidial yellow pigment biosynthesis polyketide synthase [Leucoagaricus sp. SymC.cos]|nr:Conidial yellow pigment biosynthesis polyketide synthase [Leucoagaricus sp. SymC.cos]
MADLHIPVFAGQGTSAFNTSLTREQALSDASTPSGSTFLAACHESFIMELSTLSLNDLEEADIDLADFSKPLTLLTLPSARYRHNPVISGPTLFLLQILRYLAFIDHIIESTGSFTPFSDVLQRNAEHGTGILGLSSGILAAVVVGTSLNASTFISRAVEVFRLAIWIGIRAQAYRRNALSTALPDHDSSLPWSLVFMGMTHDVVDDAVQSFNKQIGEQALFVTAITDATCITVSGRPDYLTAFSSSLSATAVVHKTSLDTLYHASALAEPVRDRVLFDINLRSIGFPAFSDIRVPIRSTLTGDAITRDTTGAETLIELVVNMIINQPVNWISVVEKAVATVPGDVSVKLLNCGPGTGLTKGIDRAFSRGNVATLDLSKAKFAKRESSPQHESIAIVGMAVNMPGAPNNEKLWEVLETGINTISEIPEHRFKVSDYNSGKKAKRSMTAHTGNFIENVDEFDNKFFKISPREAKSMDPQQRLLLHAAYEALEDAGYVPYSTETWSPETFGCYVGVATHDYLQNLRNEIDVYYSTGTLKAFLSGRISYAMQLSGPSVVIDTACSSSAVAFYQGARALVNGDCSAALVGGVNIVSSPDMFLGLDRAHFLSPTGQCKAFDASADGYSRSEGVGMFVLKRLSDAVAENDNILGVIRAIEVNQSGLAHSITHPHAPTQANLFHRVLETADIDVHRVNVIEAHGTGTQAGDPNELESIRSVFARNRPANNPLHITSVKSNMGHLEAASGAAGLAKLLLMLRHKTIPSVISLKNLNPRIVNLASDNTIIDTVQTAWVPSEEGKSRVALLNNFGAAGSNTAMILEEYVAPVVDSNAALPFVFGISAKDSTALEALRKRVIEWIQDPKHAEELLTNVSYTSTARRHLYEHRLAVSASTKEELVEKLGKAAASQVKEAPWTTAFVFSGQGSQYLGMGRSLYRTVPLFRRIIDDCHSILVAAGFPGVLAILTSEGESSGLAKLEEFEANQAAIFSLEYALAKLWMSWGIKPSVVVGHSLGEYAALVIANVLTLKGALMIIANRVRYMVQKCTVDSTSMLAVNLPSKDIQTILDSSSEFSGITIACYNSSVDNVLAGPIPQLKALKAHLDAEVRCKNVLLTVPFGYHSSAMTPLLDDLTELSKRITISPPSIPIISNVHGTLVLPGDASVFNGNYFTRHCSEPVQFAKGIQALCANTTVPAVDAWIEIGPHTTTLPMLKAITEVPKSALLLGSLRKNQDAWLTLTTTLTQLYTTNACIQWRDVFSHVPVSCVSFVTYPFATTKFWVPFKEDAQPTTVPSTVTAPPPSTDASLTDFKLLRAWSQYPKQENGYVAIFETPISQLAGSIQGHSVGGMPLCPASVYLEQVFSGLELAHRKLSISVSGKHVVIREIKFANPLVYDEQVPRTVITNITVGANGSGSFFVASRVQGSSDESVHVRGEYKTEAISTTSTKFHRTLPVINRHIATIVQPKNGKASQLFSTRTAYEVIFPRVVDYAKEYHTMQSITVDPIGMEGYAPVRLPASYDRSKFVVHPVFTDTLLHVAGFVANMHGGVNDAYICGEVGSVKVIPEQVDNDASYAVYCSNGWLPEQGVMLAEAYAVKLSQPPVLVAHLKDMHFKKVRLNSLKKGLAMAVGKSAPSSRPTPTPTKPAPAPEPQSGVSSPRTLVAEDSLPEPTPLAVDADVDIKGILAAVLDVSPKDIELDADLEELGLDSLTSIEALAVLKSEFALDLPGTFFNNYRTARKVQSYVSSQVSASKSSHATRLTKALKLDTVPLPLQKSTSSTLPLFLIHDGSGLINYYNGITSLERQVWGFNNPHFASSEPWSGVPAMASAYAKCISNITKGPVILGGWSFGGVAAYETSLQLAKMGIKSQGILLIDSPSPINHVPLSDALIDSVVNLDARSANSDLGRLVKAQFAMNARMLGKYDPRATGGTCPPLILLRSSEGFNPPGVSNVPIWLADRSDPSIATAGWETLAPGPVKVLDIPGHHFTPFYPANVSGCMVSVGSLPLILFID